MKEKTFIGCVQPLDWQNMHVLFNIQRTQNQHRNANQDTQIEQRHSLQSMEPPQVL